MNFKESKHTILLKIPVLIDRVLINLLKNISANLKGHSINFRTPPQHVTTESIKIPLYCARRFSNRTFL